MDINDSNFTMAKEIHKHIEQVKRLLQEHHNIRFEDDQVVLFALKYYLLNQKAKDELKIPIKKDVVMEITNQKENTTF